MRSSPSGCAVVSANYDAINDKLAHDEAPEGLLLHYAGFDEEAGVFRVVNIWDSQAQGQSYLDTKVIPAAIEVMGDEATLHHVLQP